MIAAEAWVDMTITDFTALDVETANADPASICSIGLAHFRSGAYYKSLTILVDPETHFDASNIAIHGIRPEDVAGKPTIANVLPVIGAALREAAVIHHSPFDRTATARAAARYKTDCLPCTWLDSVQVARRAWEHYQDNGGYGLKNLATAFGITFRHHDAAEDARAAGLIVLRAIADTKISLQDWLTKFGCKSAAVSYQPMHRAPSKSRTPFERYARDGNPGGHLFGETIVFTGSLSVPRSEAAQLAASAGCCVADSVTKKTTILVVGDQDLRLTNGQEKSTKHRKVEAMIASGAAIRILRESEFMSMVE